jgi:RNA polymerase sigma-70 factor (ECF subfamily)
VFSGGCNSWAPGSGRALQEEASDLIPTRSTDRVRREFEALAMPHLDGLYAAALRLTKNPRDAEDLVQDSVLRAFRFFDKFERGTNMKAWLYKIVTNTFINRYRRVTKERSIVDDDRDSVQDRLVSRDAAAQAEDPERAYFDRQLSDDVLRALDSIPVDFRMTVILADLQDFSYKEIADILDIPVGTVMSRLFRGRRLLQTLLAEYAAASGVLQASREAPSIDLGAWKRQRGMT